MLLQLLNFLWPPRPDDESQRLIMKQLLVTARLWEFPVAFLSHPRQPRDNVILLRVDIPSSCMIDKRTVTTGLVILLQYSISNNTRHLRTTRGIVVVVLVLSYIFGALLHHDADVNTFNSSQPAVALASTNKSDAPSSNGILADHHCHGCFSVSISEPSQLSVNVETCILPLDYAKVGPPDRVPELDTPPPKFLT